MILFLIVSIIFILTVFAFYQWKNILSIKQSELNQLQISENQLREELSILQTRLHYATKDPLTRLLGWSLFEDRVKQNIQESACYQFSMAILFIDINEFSVINEALGYEAGDRILNEVSQRLQNSVREMDSVSRLSKDIFVVMLTQLGKPETAASVAQRILESLEQPISIKEQAVYITACIGISIYPADGLDAATLFGNADQALMLAKEKGHQNYHFYQQKDVTHSMRELELATGLKQDSFLSECEVYYQPIMHVRDKTIFCMQALLQWRHPELGLIQANELFNYMEKHDKSNIVFTWLLKKACQRFMAFRSVGFTPELLGISLSVKQLKNSQFIYGISQILQECEFKPEWLLLKIEGNFLHTPFESMEKSFNMLKYLNIKLAINHFGTSHFSLMDLKKFTVDYLILDQAMISDLQQNEKAVEFIHACNLLAQSVCAQLIIQGVDSEIQMKILRDLGCDLIQGQWIGEPLAEQTVEEVL